MSTPDGAEKRPSGKRPVLWLCTLLLGFGGIGFWLASPGRLPGPASSTETVPTSSPGAETSRKAPPSVIDVSPSPRHPDEIVPTREISPDHQPKRVVHKDKDGRAILEDVYTPQGIVNIHRTFRTTDGKLLKEEAFLEGKPVPVPAVKP